MPNFADHFNGANGEFLFEGERDWQYVPRDPTKAPTFINKWKYDRGHVVRGGVQPTIGGANTLLYRPGVQITKASYDIRATFAEFNYSELYMRFTSTDALDRERLSVLVQAGVGKFVRRIWNRTTAREDETVLATWERQVSTDYEIYVVVFGDVFHIYDSGFLGNAAKKAAEVTTTLSAGRTGVGIANGRCGLFEVHDGLAAGAGQVDYTFNPVKVLTGAETYNHLVDDVTAAPQEPQFLEPRQAFVVEPYVVSAEGEPFDSDGNTPSATLAEATAGTWRLFARAPDEPTLEVSHFRGFPTLLKPWDSEDPFSWGAFSFLLPGVTIFDKLGINDLEWLTPNTDIDLVYGGTLPAGYPGGRFVWEGFASSFDWSEEGLTVTCQGALRQLDYHLAKPQYSSRPIPYEVAIANQFRDRPDLRLRPLKVEFPAGWGTTYVEDLSQPLYMRPTGVRHGDQWTGLVTRATGSFDQSLSSYVQSLLGNMVFDTGRWTLDLDPGRQPVLRVRPFKTAPDSSTISLDPIAPGVEISLTHDWSQAANVAFGQGVSLAGEGWSGQIATTDGSRTRYEPLAALPVAHPLEGNAQLDTRVFRREVMLEVQQGLTLAQAKAAAAKRLARFSEPGYTGTITLKSDVFIGSTILNRKLIKAGMSIHLPKAFFDGVMLQVTKASVDRDGESVTLTVDSKFRDASTVDEMLLRGRDALAITRQIIGGQYAPPIPDQLVPWNYSEGSGFIPSGPDHPGQLLFEGFPRDIPFPWTEITRQRRPSDPLWAKSYVKIPGPASASNSDLNWSVRTYNDNGTGVLLAYPVRAAQQASIRLLQIAAYSADGYVMPVRFHVGFYAADGVQVTSMPQLTDADAAALGKYAGAQRYPFFEGAFEQFRSDGTKFQNELNTAVSSAGLIRAYGTKAAPAGFWPNPAGQGAPTGLLVDEGVFEIDTTRFDSNFNPFQPRQLSPRTGYIYVMIYCEEHTSDVYFLGRMLRQEPGATV